MEGYGATSVSPQLPESNERAPLTWRPVEPVLGDQSASRPTANPSDSNSNELHVKSPRVWYYHGSLLLENKGAVARDHLASERTFLAWLRTSLSLASVGVAITQLLSLSEENNSSALLLRFSKGLGICFILVAIMTLSIGSLRYFAVQELLLHKEFPVSRLGVSAVYFCITMLSIVTFTVVLAL